MTQYAISFLLESLVMSAVILSFLLLNALSLKVFSAKLRYAVWTVLLAGLLIPMNQVIGDGFIAIPLSVEMQKRYAASETLPGESSMRTNLTQALTAGNTVKTVKDATSGLNVSPLMACIIVWGIVAAAILFYQIRRYFRFVSIIRRWGEPVKDEATLSIFRSVQEEKGLGNKKIDLRICEFVPSTLLTGFLRPMVVLPKKHFEADELELIFRHELIHFKRYDLFIKLLSVIAVSVHWFNPIVHWMNAAMQADGEACCDEAVLQDLGTENRQFYAELMIKMIGDKNVAGIMLSTCFYGGKRSVKRRLDAILDNTRKIKKTAYAIFIAFSALTVFSGSVFTFTIQNDITPHEFSKTIKGIQNISPERANEVALKTIDGGIVGRTEIKYNKNGEITHYTVTLVKDYNKYDVNVDAYDEIIKNVKMEQFTTVDANVSDLTGIIGNDRAMSIALERAGGGVVTMCRLETKPFEDLLVYHVHVANNAQWEHCVEIDAVSGSINFYEPRHKP